MNYCLTCERVQPDQQTVTTVAQQKGRRLTKEERSELIQDIKHELESGTLNMQELSKKYDVDRKTVSYWKKKMGEETEQRKVS